MDDDVMLYIEGRPFADAVRSAAGMRWSGILRAMRGEDQVGVVVMRDGHVAWAVSNDQTENFGSFLERIGMVPRDRLDEVVRKYRSMGKSKKLGALLEEAGLLSHATLRECLQAHVAAAMAADRQISLLARNGEMAVDAGLIFMLSEVLPENPTESSSSEPEPLQESESLQEPQPQLEPEQTIGRNPGDTTSTRKVVLAEAGPGPLTGFSPLPGYQYSFVADWYGNLLALHAADGVTVPKERVVPAVTTWLGASELSSSEIAMGGVVFTFVQYESGSLFTQLADHENPVFVAVAFNENGKLGVVMHKVSELLPLIRGYVAEIRS